MSETRHSAQQAPATKAHVRGAFLSIRPLWTAAYTDYARLRRTTQHGTSQPHAPQCTAP
ncbi:hypothetical protein LZ757_01755 [Xylella fastidiosa subsp. morus]|uniref:hypothetical protein n=1 Tax=Xylella fastidiosa TaxID=2371 RepID=UPI0003014DD9|nr:hypothetical protein [Xylella fastidiosa]KAJ4853511.1 hypothetical protein XYFPCFBP8418_004495 [Xylella fastidiosa subsp. multiplex]MBS9444620.1 hypothetical protein [Xylella fastidiosa subsp. multiplex]MBS9450639.1 hypothetical protein [Xylella fastidiosa subsp. multiplex]MBS9520760.1 hypothetical protein [Xylella fastidiosa subsp. multiplex]MCH7233935.1 hypothetical protein [Xylella fastidiosa subsp. multiplex]